MRIRVALIAAISVFSLLINGNSPSFAAQPRKILTGWIPYYQMKTSLPSALTNSDLVKEVMPFWFTLNLNGNKSSIVDLYTPANPSIPMASPLNNLRAANFKIIPTITDGTPKLALANYLSTSANRSDLVSLIVNLVTTNGFDGIDLDFENFAFVDGNTTWAATKPNWVAFVNELAAALHAQQKLISITSPYLLDPTSGKQGYYVYRRS